LTRQAALVLVLTPALALGSACVSISWQRESRHHPIPRAAVAGLVPGESDLGRCLELFGAPLWVWEHVEDGRQAAALAYGWSDERDFGLRLSVPVTEYYSASLDYDQIDAHMRGLVLFFDEGWKLTSWRTGLLRDLTREARRPPAALEEDA
jgi:hypothetical protein